MKTLNNFLPHLYLIYRDIVSACFFILVTDREIGDNHEVGMIKSELIECIGGQMTYLTEKQVADGINKLLELMSEALIKNERIEIRGFGSFSLHYHLPRNAHNPKTGERVVTKAKFSPHFKPGKELRERVNASRARYVLSEE